MQTSKQLLIVDDDGEHQESYVKLHLIMHEKMPMEDQAKCREIFDRAYSEIKAAFIDR